MTSRRLPLNLLISLLVAAMVMLSLGVALWLFVSQLRTTIEQAESTRMTDLARVVAGKDSVRTALAAGDEEVGDSGLSAQRAALQEEIDGLRRELGVDFIVVMTPDAIRLTHPDPQQIGLHFRGGDEGPALAGEHYASRSRGTLGVSIRGFSPVHDVEGEVIGAVSVGVTLASLLPSLEEHRQQVMLGVLALMLAAGLGAWWLARYIKHVLLGLEPYQIARLVKERQALLASVHEGILAVDDMGRITLANEAAKTLLGRAGLGEPPLGQSVTRYIPHSGMLEVLASGRSALDQEVLINGQLLLANRVPIRHEGRVIGAVATFRDKSEVDRLAEELTGVQRYAEALRASTHEFKNKLHVILGLVKMADLEALQRYLHELAELHLTPTPVWNESLQDPVLAGFLLGKGSEARERGIRLDVRVETAVPAPVDPAMRHTLITVIGNLLENAFEALSTCEIREVSLTLGLEEDLLTLDVQDTGPGIPDAWQTRVFEHGVSTKGEHRGLGLALVRERLEVHGGSLALYSEAGRGTLVEVTLPYASGATPRRQEEA
ncbi:DcuS/MalK family sensor histidine kinase [Litchfieldella anticariensis]|uniref:DcuS/MalK family sensor histidine kinase n=1 Tax=Litchfieldella anticariensis TaxID=258591 RepID=UPI0005552156|nr:DcuS/MalK family sensor histidine kinase [Halomonas anticariensis]